MSGTSLDGMDAALVQVRRAARPGSYRARLEAFLTLAYPLPLRERIADAARGVPLTAETLARLDADIADLAARAALLVCRRAQIAPVRVAVIGSHGQTIFHGPAAGAGRISLQLGSPARIAAATSITTVGDFRTADLCAGGEGAPLMPIVHRMLLAHPRLRRAVQNLGGIGNVTWLAAAGRHALAFDTGPGVMLIDAVVRDLTGGRKTIDRGGRLAARGQVHTGLIDELLATSYFAAPPPKSTGRETFGSALAERVLARARRLRLGLEDTVATVTAFTAASIADQYGRFLVPRPGIDEVILAGGGARNPLLVRWIRNRLAPLPVRRIETIGGNGDALEAIGFAIFAVAALAGVRFDLSGSTGACRPVRLGVIAYPS